MARRLNRDHLAKFRNPKTAGKPLKMYKHRGREAIIDGLAELLDRHNNAFAHQKGVAAALRTHDNRATAETLGSDLRFVSQIGLSAGQAQDVDGNLIHFDGDTPYIIINDYQALERYRVYVDVFAVEVKGDTSYPSYPSGNCTYDNPERSAVVFATRIGTFLTGPESSFSVIEKID